MNRFTPARPLASRDEAAAKLAIAAVALAALGAALAALAL